MDRIKENVFQLLKTFSPLQFASIVILFDISCHLFISSINPIKWKLLCDRSYMENLSDKSAVKLHFSLSI